MFNKKNTQSYHKHYKIKHRINYISVFKLGLLLFTTSFISIKNEETSPSFIFDQTISYSGNETYLFNYGNYYNYEDGDKQEQPLLEYEPESLVNLNQPVMKPKYNSLQQSFYCDKNLCQESVFKWHESKKKKLYVGGIFPMVGGWPGGQACLPSAIMALNEVNLNANVLPGYKLELNWFNSEVN
jgi:hypothetical protein